MQDITTLLGGGNSSLTGQTPISVNGGVISLGPMTGLQLIDNVTNQTVTLTAQDGGIFLGALQFVSLYYLLNTFGPTKQNALVEGQNISIDPVTNVISAVNGAANFVTSVVSPLSVVASGANAGQLSIDLTAYATENYVTQQLANYTDTPTLTGLLDDKMDAFTVHTGLSLVNGVLSCTVPPGIISSVQSPLDLNNGVLSVDLAAYATQAYVGQQLSNYTLTSDLTTLLNQNECVKSYGKVK